MTELQQQQVPKWSMRDEADLTWYHGIGQTAFERSTMGGMLERAKMMSMDFKPTRQSVLGSHGQHIGWESPISARPTCEQREVSGYVPDDAALMRYAHVSSLMQRLECYDRLAAEVVSCIFGDLGARWAASDHGRNGALYHLTAKGSALIDAATKEAGALSLTAVQRIESICIAERAQSKPERKAQLAVCSRQAADLERRARAAWHTVKPT